MIAVCPQCGSAETRSRSAAESLCEACGTRFRPPAPLWERFLVALVFFVPGVVLAILAIGILVSATTHGVHQGQIGGWLVCSGTIAVLASICLFGAVRELIGRPKPHSKVSAADSPRKSREAEPPPSVIPYRPLLPEEEAEVLIREIAQKHGAKRILQTLGHLPQKPVDNAAACYAPQMENDETPLVSIDTSFLNNGKAGFLLTNRGLYSSFYSRPVWLAEINDVSYVTPSVGDLAVLWLLVGGIVFSHLLGGALGNPNLTNVMRLPLYLALPVYVFSQKGRLQNRLRVNGKTVYRGKRLHGAFWVELLTEVAEAARQTPPAERDSKSSPDFVVLEIMLRVREDDSVEVRQIRNPSWNDVEQSIRALDQDNHPSLRIWAGEVEQAPALDILGGNGKYVLRELGDGWTYYDPSAGEEEIEVCTGFPGHRAAAFYVCTDLQRVLEIARHYIETGTPE